MKTSFIIPLLSTLLITTTNANFHLSKLYNTVLTSGTSTQTWTSISACPSNDYSCKCLTNYGGIPDSKALEKDSFSIPSGFCGQGKLDFYKGGDGSYKFYNSGGDGSVRGQCWVTPGSKKECSITLGSSNVQADWVCYSDVCG